MKPTIFGVPVEYPDPIADSQIGAGSRRGSGQVSSALSCDRAYTWRSIEQLSPREDKASMLCGSLIHGLLAYWRAAKMPKKPAWYWKETADEWARRVGADQPAQVEKAQAAVAHYKARYVSDTMRPLYVEAEIGATVLDLDPQDRSPGWPHDEADSELVTARFDFIVEQTAGPGAGQIYLGDTKSKQKTKTARLPTWNPQEHALKFQQLEYYMIAQSYFGKQGKTVAGFLIERIKQEEPHDVDRQLIEFSAPLLQDIGKLVRRGVEAELRIRGSGLSGDEAAPTGILTGSCGSGYGFSCDYRDLCLASSLDVRQTLKTAWFDTKETA